MQWSDRLVFYLNGSRISLPGSSLDPDTTLLQFIRSQPGLQGTKLGCGEGGCGACTVVVQSRHPTSGRVQHLAINACLAPLVSVDGKHVITVEGTSCKAATALARCLSLATPSPHMHSAGRL